MALKMVTTCTRCKRDDEKDVADVKAATELEEGIGRRAAAAKKIEEMILSIPENDRPDFLAFMKGRLIVHTTLCSPVLNGKADSKAEKPRDCTVRMGAVLDQAAEYDERKPRTKKVTAPVPLTDEVPPKMDAPEPKAAEPEPKKKK